MLETKSQLQLPPPQPPKAITVGERPRPLPPSEETPTGYTLLTIFVIIAVVLGAFHLAVTGH
jgi:hypothetical protein